MKNNPIILVSGDKGGVGKSITATILTEWMVARGIDVNLVETDTSNADVLPVIEKVGVKCHGINLDTQDGWLEFGEKIAVNNPETLVVNMGARVRASMEKHAIDFLPAMEYLKRPVVLVWVINRGADSVRLLQDTLDILPGLAGKVVVKNLFFSGGHPEKFLLWEGSKTRERFEADGGKTVALPELYDTIQEAISLDDLPYNSEDTAAAMPIMQRSMLMRWVNGCFEVFDGIRKELHV